MPTDTTDSATGTTDSATGTTDGATGTTDSAAGTTECLDGTAESDGTAGSTGSAESAGTTANSAHPAAWVDQVMWWHVYPLGVDGRDVRGEHRAPAPGGGEGMARVAAYLDHAVGLGLNGLALGPVFASSTHGYDTLDHFAIDERLGTRADFDALVAACRARGIRILLDGVFNHVGREHPFARRALADGPTGEYAGWFRIDWDAAGGPRFADFEGHGSLVALDHTNPAVQDYVAEAMIHWLDAGADGWRLDAAYAVDPAFWAAVLPRVRAAHPGAWIVGEMIHGDYAAYVRAAGLDSVTEYELWKAIWSSLATENLYELDWTLRRHDALLDTFVPMTFVGNHDVTRIVSQVGERRAVAALAVLATVAGVPSIYYGDEWGWQGVKEERLGGDDAVRPALPARPEDVAGSEVVLRAHREVLGLRRRHPWLASARTEVLELANTRIVYRSVERAGPGVLVVELEIMPDGGAGVLVRGGGGEVLARV